VIVLHDLLEFWMGHTGDTSARYSTNKILPEDTINAMRETYLKCEAYITTEANDITQDEVKKGFRIEFLSSVIGYSQDKIDQFDLANKSNEEFQRLIIKGILRDITCNGTTQKIMTEKEMEKYMEQGYEFYATLPSGRIVMKLPS